MIPKIFCVEFMYLAALLLSAFVVSLTCTVIILLSNTQLLLFFLRVRGVLSGF